MNFGEAERVLSPLGFTATPGFLGLPPVSLSLARADGWVISASITATHIDFALAENPGAKQIGTLHRVASFAALTAHAGEIVAELQRVSPDSLLCHECETRYVAVKSGRNGLFMSCTGSDMRRKDWKRRGVDPFECRGVRRDLDLVVTYG